MGLVFILNLIINKLGIMNFEKECKEREEEPKICKAFKFGRTENFVLVVPREFEEKLDLIKEKPFSQYFLTYLDDNKLIFEKLKIDVKNKKRSLGF